MTKLNSNLMSNVKQVLCQHIIEQGHEIAALRAQLSEARAMAQVNKTERHAPVAEECREHEYDTVAEAMARCKELVAWDTDRRYMFVVRGNKVICKIRATH